MAPQQNANRTVSALFMLDVEPCAALPQQAQQALFDGAKDQQGENRAEVERSKPYDPFRPRRHICHPASGVLPRNTR